MNGDSRADIAAGDAEETSLGERRSNMAESAAGASEFDATSNVLNGRQLAAAYLAAARWLDVNSTRLDALNVFPVPDGDTGKNMRDTMAAASAALRLRASGAVAEVAECAADAALMGARGNSGVILSQILGGIAAGLKGRQVLDGPAFIAALAEAAKFAYRAVAKPVEGTMLTVIREVAEAAAAPAVQQSSLCSLLEIALARAHTSIEHTPDLLPVLRHAGVVDAGAAGLGAILEGVSRYTTGQSLEHAVNGPLAMPTVEAVEEASHNLEDHGYCTNFVVRNTEGAIPVERFRATILEFGASAVVAGTGRLVKVHVHTDHPGRALEAAAVFGELTAIEIINMRDQVDALHPEQARRHEVPQAPNSEVEPNLGLVVVVPSQELARLVNERSGAVPLLGGQTMNPSVGELVAAIRKAGGKTVVILPNNSNVIMTAREAGRLSGRETLVVPTASMPQGVAAALAFVPHESAVAASEAMIAAAQAVVTVEVTTASRSATFDGINVEANQPIALIDGRLAVAGTSRVEVALQAVQQAAQPSHSLLTIYIGADAIPEESSALQARLGHIYEDWELETVQAGQPHYPYIISLE